MQFHDRSGAQRSGLPVIFCVLVFCLFIFFVSCYLPQDTLIFHTPITSDAFLRAPPP